ncbi:MAG: efflux RND transporter periplasmic adaptor subunit, partial [Pseudomonadota bacterium]
RRNGGGRNRNKAEDLNTGKIYILRDGKPTMVRVQVGITDGRSTAITARDLVVGDKVIVSELQTGTQMPAGGSTQRAPRMF